MNNCLVGIIITKKETNLFLSLFLGKYCNGIHDYKQTNKP